MNARLIVEASHNPKAQDHIIWRITALTEQDCQRQIEKLMNARGVQWSEFSIPALIHFADDKCIGWWRAIGSTMEFKS